ncbi:MAG TPA: rhodanese-like domain-containing protein [Kiritimatiellae bacterium]|nr:rhodanese-like domain-containing protein [Kiritimatiellia bacterium]
MASLSIFRWFPAVWFRSRALIGHPSAILTAAALLALIANHLSPRGIPWLKDWSHYVEKQALQEGITVIGWHRMRELLDRGTAVVFDARALPDYDRGHIPGALPFPEENRERFLEQYSALLHQGTLLVAYCSGDECDDSLQLLRFLQSAGCTNLALYAGGWEEWRSLQRER